MTKIKIMIVDEQTLVREGIRALLNLVPDFEVVGEAANGKEAVENVGRLLPDVVLMDLAMPIMTGLEATRRILREFPQIKIIALTQHEDSEYIIPMIQIGAHGFVTKMEASLEIVSAIRTVYRGESFLSSPAATALIHEYRTRTAGDSTTDPYEQLTDREREVLKLVVEGKKGREIADIMVISPKTVEAYKTSLKNKLHVHNQTDLIKFALRKHITAS
jgi:DNA-binding NarL/FixJ family response regulator